MFDKKIKRGIIHHARQRRTESACRFEFEIHHFIYFPTPLYTKTRCQAGFCVCWGFFYLFETIGRRGVSQSKCPEGGTRLPSGSWAGDGMPRITCVGKLPNGRFPLLNQESFKTVQVLRFDDAFQIKPVLPVFLHLHAAALPHGGGKAQFIVGQQHL